MKEPKVDKKKILTKPMGLPKSGGRKAGTPNKKSIWLREELEKAEINWGEQFKASLEVLDYERAKILISLLPYLNPRIKERDSEAESEESSEQSSILEIIK